MAGWPMNGRPCQRAIVYQGAGPWHWGQTRGPASGTASGEAGTVGTRLGREPRPPCRGRGRALPARRYHTIATSMRPCKGVQCFLEPT